MKHDFYLRAFALTGLSALIFLASPVHLLAGGVIEAIQVEGVERIEADTVKSHLEVAVGDRFDAAKMRKGIKALFDTGFFKDVTIDRDGGKLVVRVVENPMINEISFEGNDAFSKEDLNKIIQVKPQSIYNRAKTERDLSALRQAFRVKGLFLAKIDMLVNPTEHNQVNLVYRINEGEKSKVKEVRVIGSKEISESRLIKKLMIKPTNWLSWWSEDDTYDREKLLFDQAQLRNFYLDEGYVRVRVDSSVAELTPDRRAFVITHTVHEGKRYRLGSVTISGDFDELPQKELHKELAVIEGDWYSRANLRKSIEKLTDKIGDFGYAFLDINPEPNISDEKSTVSLDFKVVKGKRVYLNRIEISGNARTKDEVIRREIAMVEGDLFSSSSLRQAKSRIKRLNYFENVEITTPPAQTKGKVDLKVNVEEKSTGTFTIGAGYSSTESFLGTASISQNNFLGRGQRLVLSVALSGLSKDYSVSFTEPYFLGRNLSAGFDIFNQNSNRTSISSYTQDSYGGALRLGFPISENLRDNLKYQYSNTDIKVVGNTVSKIIQEQADRSPYAQSMVSNTLTWDNVDDPVFPTDGHSHQLTTDGSGLGGDVRFLRVVTDHQVYYPFSHDADWVGHLRGRAGVTGGLGDDVPIFERFFLGGSSSVRGFKRGGIGPRTADGSAYGGVHYEQMNAELLFPLLNLREKGVRGVAFLDTAYIGDWNLPADVGQSGGIRVSTGIGVNWNSPFGPLRVTLGTPLVKENFDETRIFDFTMGTSL